jgi:hypothetical protein
MEKNCAPAGEDALILALAAGATAREAAERAGMGERTVYRRLMDAEFRRAVGEARARIFDSAVGRLTGLTDKATETLARLMESEKPSEALGAAKAVLELGPRLLKAAELEEQICRWEDEADGKIDANDTRAGEEELILALAAGATAGEAAEQAGVGEQTAHRRLADAGFRRAVSRTRGRVFDTALGRLTSLAGKATGVFERLMESDKPSVARRAAKAVLQLGPRLREATELQQRLSRLKDQADENQTAVIIDNGRYVEAST